MSVVVYAAPEVTRSVTVADAMLAGIRAVGDPVTRVDQAKYLEPVGDVAVFYGLYGNLKKIFDDYRRERKTAVYIDLGYWGRINGGKLSGYHKVSVNSRHPTEYFQLRKQPPDRAAVHGVVPAPWTRGHHILLAGMGSKAAQAEGFETEAWELATIEELRRFTDRPIVYRPKPSWRGARQISGTGHSPKTQECAAALQNCHAVVTHHSNVAVDGLVAGVPAFCWHGVATPLALSDLSRIEDPIRPDGREQWVSDIAYTQFSIAEMAQGVAWRHLKNEGLVP